MWFKFKTGIYNFWFFAKIIWNFRWWDYTFNLDLFSRSLEYTANKTTKYGNHEGSERTVAQIKELISLIEKVRTGTFIEEAEKTVGYEIDTDWTFLEIPGRGSYKISNGPSYNKEKENEVFDLSHKLEEANWHLIWKKLDEEMQGWWD